MIELDDIIYLKVFKARVEFRPKDDQKKRNPEEIRVCAPNPTSAKKMVRAIIGEQMRKNNNFCFYKVYMNDGKFEKTYVHKDMITTIAHDININRKKDIGE